LSRGEIEELGVKRGREVKVERVKECEYKIEVEKWKTLG
jgi:hypothetical protein